MTEMSGYGDTEDNVDSVALSCPGSSKNKLQGTSEKLKLEGDTGELQAKMIEYGTLNDMKATEQFLLNNPNFIDESTVLSLLQWCTTLTDDIATFEVVSKQCLYVLYLLDLSRQVDIDPMHCITPFFARISQPEFMEMFQEEITPFRSRLQNSSWEAIERELLSDVKEDSSSNSSEELNPLEVYTGLPPQLKKCIDEEDIEAMEKELNQLPREEAEKYLSQLFQSKLFIPVDSDEEQNSCCSSEAELDTKYADQVPGVDDADCMSEELCTSCEDSSESEISAEEGSQ